MTTNALRSNDVEIAQAQYADWRWRLNNLYWIVNKEGRRVQFKTNSAQEQFLEDLWYCNVILKARQLGFSTLIQLLMLDACIWNRDIACGTVAHTREDAEAIFDEKAKYPWDQLPDEIKSMNPATQDSARQLKFANHSSIVVGTSLRSKTLQYLHISEYGKLCAKYPEKAGEVKAGALNTVQAGQMIFVESTAEGEEGDFADLCQRAQKVRKEGRRLSTLDFKFHFYPWFADPDYRIPALGVPIPQPVRERIDKLEAEEGVHLDMDQIAWYAAKFATLKSDMYSEYPSTPKEAFEQKNKGDFFDNENFRWYHQRPKHLTLYGASDYATTEKDRDADNRPDYTVHGVCGVDPNDDIYILDWWRDRLDTLKGVEAAIDMMRDWKPLVWVEEAAQIEKSVGPFLKQMLLEQKVYQYRVQLPSNASKMAKAQSFRGRQAMGKVYLPYGAPWVEDFLYELNTFGSETARHDDQVDVCGLFGRVLDKMVSAEKPPPARDPNHKLTLDEAIAQDEAFYQSQRYSGRRGL